jgi:hypothetical protein
MERFPRGTLPPSAFAAIATVAPAAIVRSPVSGATAAAPDACDPVRDPIEDCDLSTTCPSCGHQMQPEHAHYRCGACGYRDSCCF